MIKVQIINRKLTCSGNLYVHALTVFSIVLFLSGCAVGPDYVRPSTPDLQEWIAEENPQIKVESADFKNWWEVFNDPILNQLIEKAYQDNLSLRIAGIRVLEARAQLGIAVGGLYPQQQNARGGWFYNSLSEHGANTEPTADFNYSSANIGFDAAWELDFWGKFRRAVESELSILDASVAQYDDFLVTITAEVARTYVFIRTLEARLTIAHENATIQKRSMRIAEARFEGGIVTELDVEQARVLLNNTLASIPRLEARVRQARNALAILLGILPGEVDAILFEPQSIPRVPAEISVGIPAELLRRRPDIRVAERNLAAQSARIGVAKADLYPHFSLIGSVGFSGSDADRTAAGFPGGSSGSDLWNSDSIEFFVGPAFSWDILNYGRIKNRVRVQDARFQQLVANYQNTVLKANQEVEDALVAFLKTQEELGYLSVGVDASMRSVDISMMQYREGLVDFQRVLDAQRSQTELQDSKTATQGSVALNLIATYKALGGGWEIREGKDFVSEHIKQEMQKRTDWGDLLEPADEETPESDQDRGRWWLPDW